MINNSKLDFWIKNNYNVLLTGRHGVGKTAIILEAFNRNKLNWMYFSASTMDPWVDFIGVPKEKSVGDKTYLELIRPERLQEDNIEALFFDEYNRAPKKVRNAVMELIQFKSVNGKKFNNLKVVWAAINPDEKEDNVVSYDVEALDPAQKDRFHVQIDLPYKCYPAYFTGKYGKKISEGAIYWWNKLSKEHQLIVSPRRLDYALNLYMNGGDIQDVLPSCVNHKLLIHNIDFGDINKRMTSVYKNKDIEGGKELMGDTNSWGALKGDIIKNNELCEFFLPLMSIEKQAAVINASSFDISFLYRYFNENYKTHEGLILSLLDAGLLKANKMRALKGIVKKNTDNDLGTGLYYEVKNGNKKQIEKLDECMSYGDFDCLFNKFKIDFRGLSFGGNTSINSLNGYYRFLLMIGFDDVLKERDDKNILLSKTCGYKSLLSNEYLIKNSKEIYDFVTDNILGGIQSSSLSNGFSFKTTVYFYGIKRCRNEYKFNYLYDLYCFLFDLLNSGGYDIRSIYSGLGKKYKKVMGDFDPTKDISGSVVGCN